VRAIALEALDFYIEEYHPDISPTIKLPQHVYDSAIELADHDDTKVSSRALQLLGKISHRIEEMPRVPATSAQQQRIDFDKTDLKSVIEHYGPYRFADVHPEDFEKIIAQLFRRGGFSVQETSYTGDYGADLVASKGEERVAIQVKRYGPTNSVGVGEVNQVLGGMRYYDCNRCLVITTSRFTPAAIEMAKRAKVVLWDWDVLVRQIQKVCGISLR